MEQVYFIQKLEIPTQFKEQITLDIIHKLALRSFVLDLLVAGLKGFH